MPQSAFPFSRPSRLALAAIVLIGALLRLYALDHVPPGLYQDEAVEGFDALRVLQGEFPIYFETNNGREPAFMYFLAVSIALLGRTPLALRAVSALAGTAAIPIAYLAVKELFGRRAALLAAFILATTFWPVQVSRLGLRSALLPAALGLSVWGLARAWRHDRRRDWLLAGFLFGLSLYTYLPARLAPAVPAFVASIGWFSDMYRRKIARGGSAFALAYGLTALPLGLYALGHWDVVSGRAVQVSVLNPDINQGRVLQTVLDQGLLVAKMFVIQGDTNLRHNPPGRPVFDAPMALAFLVGLAVGFARLRERRWQWIWVSLGVFLLPTLLTDRAPHFLRGYGVWPLLAVFPALGLQSIFALVKRRAGALAGRLVAAAILAGSLLATTRDYFWSDYLTSQEAYYAFDTFATDLAAEVNRFTDQGWQGASPVAGSPHGEVWIEPRLYRFTETVEFLIPQAPSQAQSSVHLLAPGAVSPPPSGRNVRLIVVPGEETSYLGLLPRPSLISIRDGSLAKADVELTPFLLFRSITAEPADLLLAPEACFEGILALLPPQVNVVSDTLSVELLWRLEASSAAAYTVFLHLYQDGLLVGQDDSFPANGLFPFNWLRPGDVIRDTRSVVLDSSAFSPATGHIGVGIYDSATGERLSATDCAGQAFGDEVFIR